MMEKNKTKISGIISAISPIENICNNIYKAIRRTASKIIQMLIKYLVCVIYILIILFIVALVVLSFKELIILIESNIGVENTTQNSAYLFTLIKIIVYLLIGLVFIVVFKEEKRISISPFKAQVDNENYSGEAITDLLITEMKKINSIHSRKYPPIVPGKPSRETYTLSTIIPLFDPINEVRILNTKPPITGSISGSITELGTVNTGPVSISIGQLLIFLRRSSPFNNTEIFIEGSLQKYGSTICLVAYHEGINSWMVCHEVKPTEKIKYEIIPDMVRDLSFKIFVDLFLDRSAKTWEGFKCFTKSLEKYEQYMRYGGVEALECAHKSCIKALSIEHDYDPSIILLYNIGLAYLNNKKYYESGRIFRQILMYNNDFVDAWHGLGKALRRLHRYEEAIKCYDVAIKCYNEAITDSTKSPVIDPDLIVGLMTSKGHALRHCYHQKYFDESLQCFRNAIEKKYRYSFAWAGKALVLECLAQNKPKKKKEEMIKEAIISYEKAADFSPDGPSKAIYGGARARLYSERNKPGDEEKRRKCCDEARNFADELTDYNRACFEVSCGDLNDALKCLKKALWSGEIKLSWVMKDPDTRSLRENRKEEFDQLVQEYKKEFGEAENSKIEKIHVKISDIIIHRMLKYETDSIDRECKEIYENIQKESEYIRACYYAVCEEGIEKALDLLRISLESKQVSPDEVRVDPDFIFIRNNNEFIDLINKFSKDE